MLLGARGGAVVHPPNVITLPRSQRNKGCFLLTLPALGNGTGSDSGRGIEDLNNPKPSSDIFETTALWFLCEIQLIYYLERSLLYSLHFHIPLNVR